MTGPGDQHVEQGLLLRCRVRPVHVGIFVRPHLRGDAAPFFGSVREDRIVATRDDGLGSLIG